MEIDYLVHHQIRDRDVGKVEVSLAVVVRPCLDLKKVLQQLTEVP